MTSRFDLADRHILITGASGGLGEHFARTLAAAGALVTLTARREGELERVAAAIRADGGRAGHIVMDVTVDGSVEAAFDRAEAVSGPVVGLVNNAGVTVTRAALELDAADWDRVVNTDLRGVWLVAQAAGKRMVRHKTGGSIVNVASILGLRVAGGLAPYAVAKAGVVQLTKALALEWARHGIRVNALAPGYIETDINRDFFASEAGQALVKRIPQRRLGRASDLDGPLRLLLSDAGAYMTGAVVAVDGGHLVSSL